MKSFLTGKEPRERLRELILEEHVECGCQCPPQVWVHLHHHVHQHYLYQSVNSIVPIFIFIIIATVPTNTIPYRRTKTHIWDKVLMGIWVHPITITITIITIITITTTITITITIIINIYDQVIDKKLAMDTRVTILGHIQRGEAPSITIFVIIHSHSLFVVIIISSNKVEHLQ